jgi:DNA-binding winged helix-turn-helix (wHTH) protein
MDMNFRHSGRQGFVIGEHIVFDTLNDQLISVQGEGPVAMLKPVHTRVLWHFVNHPRVLLPRRELFDQCWREYGMEVCDNSLNQVVHALRDAFHMIDPASSYIKTVPRIGYALLAETRPWEERWVVMRSSQFAVRRNGIAHI